MEKPTATRVSAKLTVRTRMLPENCVEVELVPRALKNIGNYYAQDDQPVRLLLDFHVCSRQWTFVSRKLINNEKY